MQRDGWGKYSFNVKRNYYEGNWKFGKMEGKGKMVIGPPPITNDQSSETSRGIESKEIVLEGIWEDDELVRRDSSNPSGGAPLSSGYQKTQTPKSSSRNSPISSSAVPPSSSQSSNPRSVSTPQAPTRYSDENEVSNRRSSSSLKYIGDKYELTNPNPNGNGYGNGNGNGSRSGSGSGSGAAKMGRSGSNGPRRKSSAGSERSWGSEEEEEEDDDDDSRASSTSKPILKRKKKKRFSSVSLNKSSDFL
jgi:hypothetical protein